MFPNDSESWSWANLANLYVQLGQYAQVIDAGEHALRVDPHSAPAARVLAQQKQTSAAKAEYLFFFQAWKDADLPMLVAAKREYGRVPPPTGP
jgi:hypothetical protein